MAFSIVFSLAIFDLPQNAIEYCAKVSKTGPAAESNNLATVLLIITKVSIQMLNICISNALNVIRRRCRDEVSYVEATRFSLSTVVIIGKPFVSNKSGVQEKAV